MKLSRKKAALLRLFFIFDMKLINKHYFNKLTKVFSFFSDI